MYHPNPYYRHTNCLVRATSLSAVDMAGDASPVRCAWTFNSRWHSFASRTPVRGEPRAQACRLLRTHPRGPCRPPWLRAARVPRHTNSPSSSSLPRLGSLACTRQRYSNLPTLAILQACDYIHLNAALNLMDEHYDVWWNSFARPHAYADIPSLNPVPLLEGRTRCRHTRFRRLCMLTSFFHLLREGRKTLFATHLDCDSTEGGRGGGARTANTP